MASRPGGSRGKGTIDVKISVTPDPGALAAKYGQASQEFRDYTPAWQRLTPRLRSIAQGIYDSQGATLGEKWRPLKDKYGKRKARVAPGMPILRLTGAMLGGMGLLIARPSYMRYGVKAPQARSIQFGFGARPFIGVTPEVEEAAMEEIGRHVEWLLSKLEASGGPPMEASPA
jgi:hypothetical protein